MDEHANEAQEITPTIEDYKKNAPMSSTMDDYVKGAQEFVKSTLQRTGTLYESTKDAVLKRSGTIYAGAKQGVSQGLKRSSTMYESAREGLNQGLRRSGTVYESAREGVNQGLRRSSTIYEGAREGVLRRSGTFGQGTSQVLQRTGTFFEETRQGVLQQASSWVGGANAYAKGFFDPNRPLKATVREINGVTLPRVGASICVIDGRAYIFGGDMENGQLADNTMHMVILPASGSFEADYTTIAPKPKVMGGPVPSGRKDHIAVVVGRLIYIFGGQLPLKAKEEVGRVWVFDTKSRRWSYHDPAPDAPYPQPRFLHAAVASEEPGPQMTEGAIDEVEQEDDSVRRVPEPIDDEARGTIFIYGGKAIKEEGQETLNDVWAFDIASRSWFTLPPPPEPVNAELALSQSHLVRISDSTVEGATQLRVDSLDVSELFRIREVETRTSKLALPSLLSEWATIMFPTSSPSTGIAVSNVSSPTGKEYLLLFLGTNSPEDPAEDEEKSSLEASSGMVALEISTGGGIRLAGTDDPEIDEGSLVKRMVKVDSIMVDVYGDPLESSTAMNIRLLGRKSFTFASGTEVDGSHFIVWGGKDAKDRILGDGYMMTVEF
jgi:hypothetical protein